VTGKLFADDPWRPGAPTRPGTTWNDLAARAYVGARDMDLSRDVTFDLASFLTEWATPNPVFAALAEESVEGSDPERLAGLARQALNAVDYVPGSAIEPQLLAALERTLAVVARDLRATDLDGSVRLIVLEGSEPAHAYVQYEGSYANTGGLAPRDAAGHNPAENLVLVADELQDAVTDSIYAAWPVCPNHQRGAHPRVADDRAVWWCTGGQGHVIALIGKWLAPFDDHETSGD